MREEWKSETIEVVVRQPVRLVSNPAQVVQPGSYSGNIGYWVDLDDPQIVRDRRGTLYTDHTRSDPNAVINLRDDDVVLLKGSPDVTIKGLPRR